MLTWRPNLRLLYAWVALALVSVPSYAKNSTTSPAKVHLAPQLKRYSECRSQILSSLRQGSPPKEPVDLLLERCNESFPAASHYVRCKKQKVKDIKTKGDELATNPCFEIVDKIEYQTHKTLPFAVHEGDLFFAGIGLNKKQRIGELAPPNFNCQKLAHSIDHPTSLEYILFGNHPRFFADLRTYNGGDLRRLLPIDKPNKKGVNLDGYGKVYGDPGKRSATVFFPSSSCSFEGPLSRRTTGLAVHYLIDTVGKVATPYFGIVYFKDADRGPSTPSLVKRLGEILGSEFKPIMKSPEVTYLAVKGFQETDDEKDPKNLCKFPREHTYIGLVQSVAAKPHVPSFALVANIQNLCEFGDNLSKLRLN